ncbi:MAG: sulfatase-like hydrolase/transferase, partial [Ardenticatenaceae bacterium]
MRDYPSGRPPFVFGFLKAGLACALLLFLRAVSPVPGGDPAPSALAMPPAQVGEQPHIIYLFTDDQRWDTLCPAPADMDGLCGNVADHPMPTVMALKAESITFSNAFLTYPLCCPSRASFLAGGLYAHRTHVMGNSPPQGSASAFRGRDEETVPTHLQAAGYETALVGGRYLTLYYPEQVNFALEIAYVPPGWDRFAVIADTGNYLDSFGVVVADDGLAHTVAQVTSSTLLGWEREQAVDFINDVCPTTDPADCVAPFFLFYNTHAPHPPALVPPGS